MARVSLGPITTFVSGRIGRLVLRQTRFGTVAQIAPARPPNETPAMAQTRRLFRVGVRAWHTLPAPLAQALEALHRAAQHGSPGPWITAFARYHYTGLWAYPFRTNPAPTIQILSIIELPTSWSVICSNLLPANWDQAWCLIFNPLVDIVSLGWQTVPAGDTLISVDKCPLPPGPCHLLLIPKLSGSNKDCGSGDAHVLP